jgi:heme exporter protein D
MDLGPHAFFIVASYGAAAVIVALLIGWIIGENRSLTRKLAEFEARGITRRSDERNSAAKSAAASATNSAAKSAV